MPEIEIGTIMWLEDDQSLVLYKVEVVTEIGEMV